MKKVSNIVLIIAVIFLIGLLMTNSNSYKCKLNNLRHEKDSLIVEYQKIKKVEDSLLKIKNKTIIKYDTIIKNKYIIKDETDSIIDDVYTWDEKRIDSTIRTYKRPTRN